jgi:hypothetical protein
MISKLLFHRTGHAVLLRRFVSSGFMTRCSLFADRNRPCKRWENQSDVAGVRGRPYVRCGWAQKDRQFQ